jgi:hypothetical protein
MINREKDQLKIDEILEKASDLERLKFGSGVGEFVAYEMLEQTRRPLSEHARLVDF